MFFLYFVDLCVFFFFYVLFMLPPQFLICYCSMNNGIAYVDGDDDDVDDADESMKSTLKPSSDHCSNGAKGSVPSSC